ncbi:hypothetical protein BU14_0052s0037 [Porphyra umbilicalis]|uniref:Uncharacterized protein n=1 Tax=Porphyra umbilicalis TaxID=2786 RepID=A0A1X6PHU1_PORUM|nr:hypothetical protein BU14_0052s0037 [Porphyra umbilicalis]|eukprot:OSX80421.1 hypothetical protein BU14_0052s0037 [Porphyra umbilicalis]
MANAAAARRETLPLQRAAARISTFPPRAAARVGVGGGDAPPQTFDAARRRRRAAAVANGACRRRQRRCARVVACRPVHGGAGRRGARGAGAVSSAPHGGFCPGAVYSGSRVDAGGGGGAGGAGHRHACRRLRPCRRWCEGGRRCRHCCLHDPTTAGFLPHAAGRGVPPAAAAVADGSLGERGASASVRCAAAVAVVAARPPARRRRASRGGRQQWWPRKAARPPGGQSPSGRVPPPRPLFLPLLPLPPPPPPPLPPSPPQPSPTPPSFLPWPPWRQRPSPASAQEAPDGFRRRRHRRGADEPPAAGRGGATACGAPPPTAWGPAGVGGRPPCGPPPAALVPASGRPASDGVVGPPFHVCACERLLAFRRVAAGAAASRTHHPPGSDGRYAGTAPQVRARSTRSCATPDANGPVLAEPT